MRSVLAIAAQAHAGVEPGLPASTSSYGVQLIQNILVLAAVCMVAWWLLRWAARRGFAQPSRGNTLRVLERVALDPRRSVYLVQAGSRTFLLGGSDVNVNLVAELSAADLAVAAERTAADAPRNDIAGMLARLLAKRAPAIEPVESQRAAPPGDAA